MRSRSRAGASGVQIAFVFRTWGGKRKNAGRKPSGARAGVAHAVRPVVLDQPVHVTLRMVRGLPPLREQVLVRALRAALAGGKERFGLRVVHHSIQRDHVHLVVEAPDRANLTRGMRGLDVRIARGLNRTLYRRGQVLGDRYHARPLGSPTEVRKVLAYVLLNSRKHSSAAPSVQCGDPRNDIWWDTASSALLFAGWSTGPPCTDVSETTLAEIAAACAEPSTWLLEKGWLRGGGPIDPRETPGSP